MREVARLKKFTAEIAAPYTSESVELKGHYCCDTYYNTLAIYEIQFWQVD